MDEFELNASLLNKEQKRDLVKLMDEIKASVGNTELFYGALIIGGTSDSIVEQHTDYKSIFFLPDENTDGRV